jgi:hypothetical protein
MRRALAGLLVTAALLAGCSSAGGASSGGSASDPAALVSARCTRCHPLQRIRAATHDAAGWQATVTRMRTHGVQLSDAEARAVVAFLASGGAAKL